MDRDLMDIKSPSMAVRAKPITYEDRYPSAKSVSKSSKSKSMKWVSSLDKLDEHCILNQLKLAPNLIVTMLAAIRTYFASKDQTRRNRVFKRVKRVVSLPKHKAWIAEFEMLKILALFYEIRQKETNEKQASNDKEEEEEEEENINQTNNYDRNTLFNNENFNSNDHEQVRSSSLQHWDTHPKDAESISCLYSLQTILQAIQKMAPKHFRQRDSRSAYKKGRYHFKLFESFIFRDYFKQETQKLTVSSVAKQKEFSRIQSAYVKASHFLNPMFFQTLSVQLNNIAEYPIFEELSNQISNRAMKTGQRKPLTNGTEISFDRRDIHEDPTTYLPTALSTLHSNVVEAATVSRNLFRMMENSTLKISFFEARNQMEHLSGLFMFIRKQSQDIAKVSKLFQESIPCQLIDVFTNPKSLHEEESNASYVLWINVLKGYMDYFAPIDL